MSSLPGVPDPEGRVLHGFEHNEDAVILRTPPAGMALVQTVDFFPPMVDDPYLFGQIAAANALSETIPGCSVRLRRRTRFRTCTPSEGFRGRR